MSGVFSNIQSFVDVLNQSEVPYLVLRNYENMLSPELYMEGHGDIDLLCSDARLLAKAIGAKTYTDKVKAVCDDGVHYYVMIAEQPVSLDLRSVGDGYYCLKWQKEMLERRIKKDGFYVMNEHDYLYSLIHHAVLQKRHFSEEYKERLTGMCHTLGVEVREQTHSCFISLLEDYMQQNGYTYTYPTDTFVPLNKKYINTQMLEKNRILAFQHWIFDTKVGTIECLVKIKHLLQGQKT